MGVRTPIPAGGRFPSEPSPRGRYTPSWGRHFKSWFMAGETPDWRDTFCGRVRELDLLEAAYRAVAAGEGPKLAVVLGDRGMGKTRLVQELYRRLTTNYDPENYWPDASLFKGNNLRVAPDLRDPETRAHFERVKIEERTLPFLWWGFRLADPVDRNAARSDLAGHRKTLDPHLDSVFFARKLEASSKRVRGHWIETAKSLAIKGVEAIPVVGPAIGLSVEGWQKLSEAFDRHHEHELLKIKHAELDVARVEQDASGDLLTATLNDLTQMLASSGGPGVPVIVFCDDAQFAITGGDEGVLRLLTELWQRAEGAGWPLLLVVSHWSHEWHQNPSRVGADTFAAHFRRPAEDAMRGQVIELPKESELGHLARAGLPGIGDADVALLLRKADGNPQVLIELVDRVRRSPAWRSASGSLSNLGRSQIEQASTRLTQLIVDRLESDATPAEVRRAVALSSVQGMQFLCALTEAAAGALDVGPVRPGLTDAERVHRLVVGTEQGLASFVQRAYRDASRSLVATQLGEPEAVRSALLESTRAICEHPDRWAGLTRDEQVAALGILAGLGEEDKDPARREQAADALLTLIADALEQPSAVDYARATELAQRFVSGLEQGRWSLDRFSLVRVDRARQAIAVWRGEQAAASLAVSMLARARQIAAEAGTPEAQRDVSVSLDSVGRVAQAQGEWAEAAKAYRESLDIARALAKQLGTPEAQRDVGASLGTLALLALGRGDQPRACTLLTEALPIFERLAKEIPTPQAMEDLEMTRRLLREHCGAKP